MDEKGEDVTVAGNGNGSIAKVSAGYRLPRPCMSRAISPSTDIPQVASGFISLLPDAAPCSSVSCPGWRLLWRIYPALGGSSEAIVILGPWMPFFNVLDGPVVPLWFRLGQDRGHAFNGGARNRRFAASMARTIGSVMAAFEGIGMVEVVASVGEREEIIDAHEVDVDMIGLA